MCRVAAVIVPRRPTQTNHKNVRSFVRSRLRPRRRWHPATSVRGGVFSREENERLTARTDRTPAGSYPQTFETRWIFIFWADNNVSVLRRYDIHYYYYFLFCLYLYENSVRMIAPRIVHYRLVSDNKSHLIARYIMEWSFLSISSILFSIVYRRITHKKHAILSDIVLETDDTWNIHRIREHRIFGKKCFRKTKTIFNFELFTAIILDFEVFVYHKKK